MTIQATHFTPEVLLSAPCRSAGVPNSTGKLVLYTVSQYSFEKHLTTSSIRVLSIRDGASRIITEDAKASNPIWISDREILYSLTLDTGWTRLMCKSVLDDIEPLVVHTLQGAISSAKAKQLSDTTVAICVSSVTTPEGKMYWPPAEVKSPSTAKIYSSLFVRHWDAWETGNKNSLWYGQLNKKNGKWSLESPDLINVLAGTGLISPVPNFGGANDFDIARNAICFIAKDPQLNPARYTKTDLYYVSVHSFTEKPGKPPQLVDW